MTILLLGGDQEDRAETQDRLLPRPVLVMDLTIEDVGHDLLREMLVESPLDRSVRHGVRESVGRREGALFGRRHQEARGGIRQVWVASHNRHTTTAPRTSHDPSSRGGSWSATLRRL